MIGSILRYLISIAGAHFLSGGFPFGTLFANLAGSLFLGWFTSKIIGQHRINSLLATSIGTGIVGSFTTFSTFSLESLTLFEAGRTGEAIFYIMFSSIGGLVLAGTGYFLGLKKINKEGVS